MSKGLDALDYIRFYTDDVDSIGCLIYYEQFNIIEKELEALEIIKNKSVDMSTFGAFETYKDYEHFYNMKFHIEDEMDKLDEEEFNLLKGVLEE